MNVDCLLKNTLTKGFAIHETPYHHDITEILLKVTLNIYCCKLLLVKYIDEILLTRH